MLKVSMGSKKREGKARISKVWGKGGKFKKNYTTFPNILESKKSRHRNNQ